MNFGHAIGITHYLGELASLFLGRLDEAAEVLKDALATSELLAQRLPDFEPLVDMARDNLESVLSELPHRPS